MTQRIFLKFPDLFSSARLSAELTVSRQWNITAFTITGTMRAMRIIMVKILRAVCKYRNTDDIRLPVITVLLTDPDLVFSVRYVTGRNGTDL